MKNSFQNRAKISPGGLGEALGRPWGEFRALEVLWGCFGRYLGSPWNGIGNSLGILWKALEAFWGLWGALGSLFEEVFSGEGLLHDFCSIFEQFKSFLNFF